MVPYGTIWYLMVPYGTIWYHMVPYGTTWYHMVPYGTIGYHMWLCQNHRQPFIRRYMPAIRSLYVSLYAATYTPDSPIRSLYVRLYAGPYTPEYCFAWCWPPCSLQKRSSKMLPHLCKKCCHPITDLNATIRLSVRPTIRPSHHPSIFPVFIAPFSYTPTYTSDCFFDT